MTVARSIYFDVLDKAVHEKERLSDAKVNKYFREMVENIEKATILKVEHTETVGLNLDII